MTPLELKRLKLELVRVSVARNEIEFKIEERLDEISRLQDHIKIQEAKEAELKEKIDAASAAS